MLNAVLISPSEDFHRFDCDDLGLELEISDSYQALNAISKEKSEEKNFCFCFV